MASETAAVLEQSIEGCVEKKENETTEDIKQEIVSRSKENEDEEKVEMVGSPTEVAAVTHPEEKTEEDKIDLPVAVKEKVEEAVQKTPASDVSLDEGSGSVDDSKAVPEKAAELQEKESEEPPKTPDIPESLNVEEKPNEQLEVSPLESEPEVSKESKVPESTAEVVQEPEEHLETSDVAAPAPEAGIVVEQQLETPVVSNSVLEVEEKPDEQSVVSVVSDIPEVVEKQVEQNLDIPDVAVQAAEAGNVAEEKISEQSGVADVSEVEKAEEHLGASEVAIPAPEAKNAAEELLDEPVSKTLPEDEENKELPVSAPKEFMSKATGEIENKSETLDSNQSVEAEVSKDEGTPLEIESLKEEPTMVENASTAAEEEKHKEDDGESAVPDIVEQAATEPKEDTKKEESNVDVVERLLEEAAVKEVDKVDSVTEIAKSSEEAEANVEEEKEEKIEKLESAPVETVSTEDVAPVKDDDKVDSVAGSTESLVKTENKVEEEKAEESDKIEESAPAETNKTKDMGGSDSATLVDGPSSGEEKTSKDAGIIVDEEKKEEIVKEEIPTTLEASKDQNVGVTDVIDTKERGLEVQADGQPIPSGGGEVEKAEKKTEEVEKSDVQNPVEPTKDGDPKLDGDVTKQEPPAKHKQSNNLMSKVKHSIGKVKKAIIGKSPSSKTLPEGKGDVNVK